MRRAGVLCCFIVSGATALAYEVVWVRELTLIFGATVLSAGTVMAAYMAGLALGSAYWGRRADRCDRPLRLYARLEAGVALTAALTPLAFRLIQWVYVHALPGQLGDFGLLSVVRFALCFPALLAPTCLMGGTLPVLARSWTASRESMGRGAGDLYAVNTVGATLGTLVTGFVLIAALGVRATLWSAAALNLCGAGLASLLARREAPLRQTWHAAAGAATPVSGPLRRVLWGFGLSGFAAMVYEVAWTRAFVQVFGNSTYAFTTMLAAFLVGLALGAALAGRLVDRGHQRLALFALLQLVIGLWAAVATPLIEFLPPVFLSTFERTGGAFGALQLTQFLACCLLLLPTTLALGALFPVVSRLAAESADGAGASTGLPYACNTLGTVLGAVLAGFVLLPHLGLEGSLAVGVAVNLGVALWVWLASPARGRTRPVALGLGVLAGVALLKLVLVGLDPYVMTAGMYMYPDMFIEARHRHVPLREILPEKKVVFYREGYGASISVFRLKGDQLTLQTNGKTDASTGDLATQRLLAHLPMLLKPHARRVLVVGLASGCTTGSVLLHPVERVQCVEIEPAMLPAARLFDPWNHHCLDDRRLTVTLADARNFALMSREQYDVITAEPTNPWIAGVNNLFVAEHYANCAARLAPDGIMCQWLPAYNLSSAELRTALATFARVFPQVSLWAFPRLRSDFLLIGGRQPLTLDAAASLRALTGQVVADTVEVGLDDLWTLTGGCVRDTASIAEFAAGAPLNTDERPRLEFSTPPHLYDHTLTGQTVFDAYPHRATLDLPLSPAAATNLLATLGLPLRAVAGVTPGAAALRPHHPDNLSGGRPEVDRGELRLALATPDGPATLHVCSPPAANWPESLKRLWPSVPGVAGSAVRVDLPARKLSLVLEARDGATAERLLNALVGR